jgi:hypothetical protein
LDPPSQSIKRCAGLATSVDGVSNGPSCFLDGIRNHTDGLRGLVKLALTLDISQRLTFANHLKSLHRPMHEDRRLRRAIGSKDTNVNRRVKYREDRSV